MKKRISVIICFACIMLAIASAKAVATDDGFVTYQNELNGYAIDYPQSWTVLPNENVQALLQETENQGNAAQQDGGESAADMLTKIAAMDIVAIVSDDAKVNVTVSYQPVAQKYTSAVMINYFYPMLFQHCTDVLQDYTPLNQPTVERYGDSDFVCVSARYEIAGTKYYLWEACISSDCFLYSFTFTSLDSQFVTNGHTSQIVKRMLRSFQFPCVG